MDVFNINIYVSSGVMKVNMNLKQQSHYKTIRGIISSFCEIMYIVMIFFIVQVLKLE